MARYVSTIVQCDECHSVVEIDFASDYKVDEELRELGWNIETGDDICPECLKKEITKEEVNDQSAN